MGVSDTNPYQAPTTELRHQQQDRSWILWWTLIFAANLCVPMLFAFSLLEEGGGFGVAIGILLLLGVTIIVQLWFPAIIRWARIAGLVIVISQLLPILQIMAGEIGIQVATESGLLRELTDDEQDFMMSPAMSFAPAFVATVVTGGILLIAVAVLSWLIWFVVDRSKFPPKQKWRTDQ